MSSTGRARDPKVPDRIGAREFGQFQALIYREAGIYLSPLKQALVVGRLGRRLRELGLGSFRDYLDRVRADGGERVRMLDAITTNETRFFREPHHFDYLEQQVFPAWRAAAAAGGRPRTIRVWSAGCSTGEEPYSLAMLLLHHFGPVSGWTVEILATDLSTTALDRAVAATYPIERRDQIPDVFVRRYMLRGTGGEAGRMRVGPAARALVRFERLNLNEEISLPGAFDAIFCRNVMIYFDPDSRARALAGMLRHLVPGGHLFLGHSESLNGVTTGLRSVVPTVYLKPAGGRPGAHAPAREIA